MLDQTSYMTWKGSKTAKQNLLRLHGMSARCRPDVGQHSHVTCSQHVGLHVGPAKVNIKHHVAGLHTACRLHVGQCRP